MLGCNAVQETACELLYFIPEVGDCVLPRVLCCQCLYYVVSGGRYRMRLLEAKQEQPTHQISSVLVAVGLPKTLAIASSRLYFNLALVPSFRPRRTRSMHKY